MRHVHLLIKPASGLCNLNCRYCFYHDIVEKREQASYGLMTEDTLAAVLEKALAAASHSCTIAFQGGEPTLAGLDFFRKAVELQRRLNVNRVQVYNSIQTNGLLLDSQWAAFFRENHFLVGLSLDGMKDTHDLYRLGNLREDSLEEVNQRRKTLGFVEQSRAVDPACKACGYFPLCRGGCRRYRPAGEDGSLGRNCLCEGYRKFFGHALPRLRELAGMAAGRLGNHS